LPRLTFLGAARTVTGSKYLLEANGDRILVDCGLFQGLKELRQRNWNPLPVDPSTIDVAVLTHAHLDHVGYLPRLVAGGFKGRVFCTAGTADLAKVVLPDAGRLQEEDARQANKHGYSRHAPALPLFTETDAYRALTHLQPVGYERPMPVTSQVTAEFVNAGHLLGSSFVKLRINGSGDGALTLVFGGDLGRYGRPVLPDPAQVANADILLAESTYGNRVHEPDDDGERLAEIIRTTIDGGGRVIVPAFAIGRVEEVLYWIRRLEEERRIPLVPVYLDSPMALEAMRFYAARYHELDEDIRPGRRDVSAFATARFTEVSTPQHSKEVMRARKPSVIISSSGMATGGRVLHHLKEGLPDSRVTVLFVGYQAAGTRGRALLDGRESVKIHGQLVPVNARIAKIDSMSAHADQQEMLRWLGGFTQPPRTTYLVHGEPTPMDALGDAIGQQLGWEVRKPEYLDAVEF
jgi:metallo-beta-lactamase family protein